jgi:Zn-dependent oligopeptidase
MEKTYQSRCMAENTAIIEEIVELRRQQAELLGYANHATYIQEVRMAKNPDTVHKFLGDLSSKVRQLWDDEQKVMMEMKKAEAAELGFEFSGKLDFWDFR